MKQRKRQQLYKRRNNKTMAEEVQKIKKSKVAPSKSKVAVIASKKKPTEKVNKDAQVAVETSSKKHGLSIDLYDIEAKVIGKITLPQAIFGEKVNKTLLSQAVRVYLANKRQGNASTKTRGEVDGSTAKIYKQKGTGRARHGSKRAPIFVKGGVVFGPRPRDFSLDMPQKMRRSALFSSLSAKVEQSSLLVVSGFEGITHKTKEFVAILKKFGLTDSSVLLVLSEEKDAIKRSTRNIQKVTVAGATRLNAYDVMRAHKIVFMKDAVAVLEKHFKTKE